VIWLIVFGSPLMIMAFLGTGYELTGDDSLPWYEALVLGAAVWIIGGGLLSGVLYGIKEVTS
jgi:hypothetical protein